MTFLNPLFLIGISAFALPLIIHLIFKKKARVVPFPSIVFLREIDREVVRKKRLEEIIVMLLRMLVLVFLALFLSKPVLKTNLFASGSKAVAIILDDSYSMNARNGRRRFDLAREKARVLVSHLGRGDRAALFLTSKPPSEGFKRGVLSSDRLGMSRWLDSLQCGYGSSNLDIVFAQARIVLRPSGTKNRGIFLITDTQKRDWESIANREKTEDIPVVVIDVAGDSNALNVAITNVEILTTPEKRLGRTFSFRVEARNFSPRPLQGRIGMHDGTGSVIAETALALPGLSSIEKEVKFHPAEKGWHSGYFLLEKDDLDTDNKRYYALEVGEGVPVGIFSQVRLVPPDFDEVFFLTKLIDPTGQQYPFSPEEFFVISRETLEKFRVVIFPNLLKLREGELSSLESYLKSGGRVVVFLKEDFSAETLRRLLGGDSGNSEFQQGTFKVGEDGFGFQNLFLDVEFYRRIPLAISDLSDAVALSFFQDRQPLLIEKRVGGGRLMVFATGYHIDYTNLPFRHASLPFVYTLLFRLTGQKESPKYTVGESLITSPGWVSITTPEGETRDLDSQSTVSELQAPGIYEVRLKESTNDSNMAQFAVNVHPEEGDLTPVASDAEIDKAIPFSRWERVRSEEDLKARLEVLISGTPLWSYFLFAAIAAFLIELYLSNRVGQKV